MRHKDLLAVVAVSLVFSTRVIAEECTNHDDPNLLLPDLVSQAPSQVRITKQGTHRVILFTSSPANVGDGPLILHGKTITGPDGNPVTLAVQEIWKTDGTSCTHNAGTFAYHPSHHHFHVGDFASYELRKDDPLTGTTVASSTKVSFCLLDIEQLRGWRDPRVVQSDCLNQEGTQGISVGYSDVYDWYLPGQLIDLDADPAHPVQGGDYFLINLVNPDGLIWEKDDSAEANIGAVSVRVAPPRTVHTGLPQPPTSGGDGTTGGTTGHGPHAPHVPFNGPRPRLPHNPHAPNQPRN